MELTYIIVLIAILVMLVAMIMEVAHPSTIAIITLIFFLTLGFISPKEIMEGVSNEGVLTIGLLFIVAYVIEKTNMVERVLFQILKKSKSERNALLKLMSPMMAFSMFLNNTPIVVMMVPAIQKWCKEHNFSPSKFLLPVSYATIFGGMFTIIGTSTNLIVHGWLLEKGLDGFTFFYLFKYAIVGAIFGIIYLLFIGYKQLPNNPSSMDEKMSEGRQYLYEAVVRKKCELIGKTVTSTAIRRLKDLYLLKIIRDGETISPVRLEDVIHENDTLVFTGTLHSVVYLDKIKGLSIRTGSNLTVESLETGDTKLVEGIVSHNSSLIHHKIKDSNFRSKYNASIVAVHRKNERIEENVGEIKLKPGDILLMLAGKDFENNAYQNDEFYVLTNLPKKTTMSKKQTIFATTAFISMILIVAFGFLSMFEASLYCVGLFLLFNFLDFDQVKKNIPFQVLLLIVASLGIGKVLETSGTAQFLSESIIKMVGEHFGTIGLILFIYLITSILTEFITNAASAIIVLPIAFEVATHLNVDPTILAAVVAIAASASFATPIGYQTNLIVYGPGNYKFTDYLKVGLPLNLIFMIAVVSSVVFLL